MVVLKVRLRKPLHDEDKNSEIKKFCVDCKTTKTPLWRCGPSGPKTLCNACGIKYRKKKRVMAGLEKSGRKKRKSHTSTSTIGAANCSNTNADIVKTRARNGLMSESLKMGLMLRGLEKSGRKKKKSHTSTSTIGATNCSKTSADTVKTRVRNGLMSESLKMGLMLRGLEKSGRKKISLTSTSTIGATNCSNTCADTVKTRVRNGLMSGESLKMGLMLRGNEMMFQKSPIVKKQRCQRRRKLGEEEQAAFSLMALSCGSVLA